MNSKKNFKEILGCKYPVVGLAMNQISDIKLAKAVRSGGGVPSLSIFNYHYPDISQLITELDEYKSTFNDLKIFLSLGISELINPNIVNLILSYNIEFIEVIMDGDDEFDRDEIKEQKKLETIQLLMDNKIKIFVKCLSGREILPNISGIILKGSDGAGRGFYNTDKLFDHLREKYPNLNIIVSGGIGSAEQVKSFMDRGALAIGIGTLFAASKESKISTETKLKLVEATVGDLSRFQTGAKSNSLVFKSVPDTDYNHTIGLKMAIVNPESGHIFAGKSIDNITSIKPAAEIILNLTAELDL